MLERSPSMADAYHSDAQETVGPPVPGGPSAAPIRNIAELAAIAGVAVSTVSRSLANKPGVKRATRDRIQQLAKLHGFCINTYAQRLRAGKGGDRQTAAPPVAVNPNEQQPDAFTLRLLKTIFDQAIRSGFNVSSRRVDNSQLCGSAAQPAQSGACPSPNGWSAQSPNTIQVMLNSAGLPDRGMGYCIQISAQNAGPANGHKS